MKTAIQEMIDIVEMDYNNNIQTSMKVFYKMLLKGKEKEQDQIKKAWIHGETRSPSELKHINNPQGYYDSTFGDNHEAGI